MPDLILGGGRALAYAKPFEWEDPSAAMDCTGFENVEIQIIGTPGTDYVPQRSLDGTTFVAAYAYEQDGTAVTAIEDAGIYTIDGGCYVKLTGGTSSTVYIRAGA